MFKVSKTFQVNSNNNIIPGGNLMSLLVLSLLFFSLCSSVYLLYRVHALQLQERQFHILFANLKKLIAIDHFF